MAVKRYLLLLFLVKVSAGGYDLGLDRGQMSAMLILGGTSVRGQMSFIHCHQLSVRHDVTAVADDPATVAAFLDLRTITRHESCEEDVIC